MMVKKRIFSEPSEVLATPEGVHIDGPDNIDLTMTPKAALETAKRMGNAAVEVLTQEDGHPADPKPA